MKSLYMKVSLLWTPLWEMSPLFLVRNNELTFFFGKDGITISKNIITQDYEWFQSSLLEFFAKNPSQTFDTVEINKMFQKLLEQIRPPSQGLSKGLKKRIHTALKWVGIWKNKQNILESIIPVASYMKISKETQYTWTMLHTYMKESFERV